MTITCWTNPPGKKTPKSDKPPDETPIPPARLFGARGEVVPCQLVLRSDTPGTITITPTVSLFVSDDASLSPNDVVLYRVDYMNISTPTDPDGAPGDWPDRLVPIGSDPIVHEPRDTRVEITTDVAQPIWLEVRIPPSATAGVYQAEFTCGPSGSPFAIYLTIFDFEIPPRSFVPTTYGFDRQKMCKYHFGDTPDRTKCDQLAEFYIREALVHRITLTESTASVMGDGATEFDWQRWQEALSFAALTTYPIPWYPLTDQSLPWSAVRAANERFWRLEVGPRYQAWGWTPQSYLPVKDEPADLGACLLAVAQSQGLHGNDAPAQSTSGLRSLITHTYDAQVLAQGDFDIWCPNITLLDELQSGALPTPYQRLQEEGQQVWWYDSVNSREPVYGAYRLWPDNFIDHPGANQLVHGPLTWKYRLNGYLYWQTVAAYAIGPCGIPFPDPWKYQYCGPLGLGANGEGTLFYPGRTIEIGGYTDIPLPSIRLKLLGQSWTMYDQLWMLNAQGLGAAAERVASALVSASASWETDPCAYEIARRTMGELLQEISP
jgi:hypothetical protein